jgi:hypothetical protein
MSWETERTQRSSAVCVRWPESKSVLRLRTVASKKPVEVRRFRHDLEQMRESKASRRESRQACCLREAA